MTLEIEHAYGWSSKQESDANRLRSIQKYKLDVSPTEADIWFKVLVQRVTPGTEVRGRIVGPRCLFAETVQVVSPLRSVKPNEQDQPVLIARTAFANPAFWDPHNPLLYRVVVELWQDGQRCEVSGFDLGFQMIEMSLSGVLVNKKPFLLQGMTSLPQSQEDATTRRKAGYNMVLAGKGQWHWWVRTNPMGFFLLEKVSLSTLTPQYIHLLKQQPCFLGFVLDKELLDRPPSENESFLRPWREHGVSIGLELDEPPSGSLPDGISFLVCTASVLPALNIVSIPKIVLQESERGKMQPITQVVQGVLGWVDQ